METVNTDLSFIGRIRKNYSLLLFLVTAAIPLALWWLLMLLVSFSGTLFSDPKQVGMSLFMVFLFPLIAAPIISGLAILIARLLNLPNIGCLVVIVLGFIIPLVAFALVFIGHAITRKLYTGDIANIPEVMPKSTKAVPAAVPAISGEPADKLAKLKDMLDKGLISPQDYEAKKADVLFKM
jgi:hypothetical protein